MAGMSQKKYPPELKERAVPLVAEVRGQHASEAQRGKSNIRHSPEELAWGGRGNEARPRKSGVEAAAGLQQGQEDSGQAGEGGRKEEQGEAGGQVSDGEMSLAARLGVEGQRRWFGVKVWKAWSDTRYERPELLEESVLAVRATSADEAVAIAERVIEDDPNEWRNPEGGTTVITRVGEASAFDTVRLRLQSGMEIYSRLHELRPDGSPEDWPPRP